MFFFSGISISLLTVSRYSPAVFCSFVATFILLKLIDLVVGLRASDEEKTLGLDLSQQEERPHALTNLESIIKIILKRSDQKASPCSFFG